MKFHLFSKTAFIQDMKLFFILLLVLSAGNIFGQSPTGFTHTTIPNTIIGYSPANLNASGSITFEAWIKLPTTVNQTPWTNIIHLGYADNQRPLAIWYNSAGFLHCRMGSVVDGNAGCDAFSILINTWFFFQMIGTSTNRTVYINGVQVATVSAAPILFPSTGTPLYASDPWYPGGAILSEVRLWNIARTNTQGLSSMNCQMPPQANLVMYYGGPVISPSVSIAVTGGTNPTCSGTGVTFTASATNPGSSPSYQWKKDGVNVGTGTTYTNAGTTGGIITCSLTGGITCSTPVTVTSSGINLIVNTPAAPAVSSPLNYCQGATAVALSATGTNLKWYTLATGGTGSTTAPTPSTANAGTVNYFVSQTISGCEGSRAQISVVVNALPIPGISGNLSFCSSGSTTLNAGSGYSSYLWSTGATTQAITVNTAGTFSVTVTDGNGCAGTSASVITSVNPLPTVSFSGLAAAYCTTDALVTLTGNPTGGTFSGPGITGNSFSPATAGAGTHSITYTYTDGNGCTNSSSQNVTVTVCATFSTFNLTAFLEGFYYNINTMRANIFDLGVSADPAETDTVTVSLWAPASLSNAEPDHKVNAVIHIDGTASMKFPATVTGNSFYIAVKHRNHMETWSKLPVTFTSTTSYDFSNSLAQAYDDGVNPPMASVAGNKFAFYGGDVNRDGTVDASDMSDVDNDNALFAFGYNNSDASGDGATDASDIAVVDNNQQLFLFYARPY